MSRIAEKFSQLKAQGKTALIPFITAGDPIPDITVDLMHDMVSAGADIIELGVPFSDPMAEGPVIQRACERALEYHVSLADVINMVARFREVDSETPVVLMGYRGFVYYVSVKGVTGASHLDLSTVEEKLREIRKHTKLPVGVGFGIKNAETAAAISRLADAVVVGSALVSRVEALAEEPEKIGAALRELLSSMRHAMDETAEATV
ncbi:MAG: tryptophan synthase subunit alpha [Candidatus Thiodiazotropha sp.]